MIWTKIGIALTVALTFGIALGTALGTYLWHRIPERSRGAKERCRIIYDGLLIKIVNEVISDVERGDPLSFDLGRFEEEINTLSLKSTKNGLDRLDKVSKDYTDMLDIATGKIREKLEKLLRDSYKNISEILS